MLPYISEQYEQKGRFEADQFPLETKFAMLMRARLYSFAGKLANQEIQTAEGDAKRVWQERFDLANRHAQEHGKLIKSEMDKIK